MNPRKNISPLGSQPRKPDQNTPQARGAGIVQRKIAGFQARQPPAAPPVYRPQPVPRVLQAKTPALVVYRPQPVPKVLQAKQVLQAMVASIRRPHSSEITRTPGAPAVYKPQPIAKVLQAKQIGVGRDANAGSMKQAAPVIHLFRQSLAPVKMAAPSVCQRKQPGLAAAGGPGSLQASRLPGILKPRGVGMARRPRPPLPPSSKSGTIQRAFQRNPFTSDTINTIQLPTGQGFHRRHIISNHVMKAAIDAWWTAHKNDVQGAKTSVKKLQQTLDEMNNYGPNLIPGPGKENSAIGMFTNAAAKKLGTYESTGATPQQIEQGLGKYSGFEQATQQSLVGPVLSVFTNDPNVNQSNASAISYGNDLVISTDFDWPQGADPLLYPTWRASYDEFGSLTKYAEHYPFDGLMSVVNTFLSLPKPTK